MAYLPGAWHCAGRVSPSPLPGYRPGRYRPIRTARCTAPPHRTVLPHHTAPPCRTELAPHHAVPPSRPSCRSPRRRLAPLTINLTTAASPCRRPRCGLHRTMPHRTVPVRAAPPCCPFVASSAAAARRRALDPNACRLWPVTSTYRPRGHGPLQSPAPAPPRRRLGPCRSALPSGLPPCAAGLPCRFVPSRAVQRLLRCAVARCRHRSVLPAAWCCSHHPQPAAPVPDPHRAVSLCRLACGVRSCLSVVEGTDYGKVWFRGPGSRPDPHPSPRERAQGGASSGSHARHLVPPVPGVRAPHEPEACSLTAQQTSEPLPTCEFARPAPAAGRPPTTVQWPASPAPPPTTVRRLAVHRYCPAITCRRLLVTSLPPLSAAPFTPARPAAPLSAAGLPTHPPPLLPVVHLGRSGRRHATFRSPQARTRRAWASTRPHPPGRSKRGRTNSSRRRRVAEPGESPRHGMGRLARGYPKAAEPCVVG